MLSDEGLAAHLRALEESLLEPEVRNDPSRVQALLTEDFREFGSSGRVFPRESLLALLAQEAASAKTEPRPELTLTDFSCERLGDAVALVTYTSHRLRGGEVETSALRSSVWVQERDGFWRMCFHQGTRQ